MSPGWCTGCRKAGPTTWEASCKWTPPRNAPLARAIAVAVTHPFGIGNAYYRLGVSKPRSVDTVPFGCYRRDVFDRIGKFDEDLLRNQDLEFNLRLRKRRGRILLVPDVVIRGQACDSLRKLIRLYYQYGYFNPLVMLEASAAGRTCGKS